ncbi:hypothetical protein [Szabonella alba]|uniref:Uncharacterized protein n=1 Tax=Szabonella alba TaxID=2804194 RepID=A0A8K0V940_9RHOB|nr:hypothetical protein [Szabonella alba]MBL4917752.1 hypothetical protein [Szabonella alba]
MTTLELDEILTMRWPGVLRRVMGDAEADGFARGFARSIARHGKRRGWMPSQKQERIMRQMLDEYGGAFEPDMELIEKE